MASKRAPALVIQEARATGWLRAELYGDKDKARAHIATAREVLGGLRSRTGVNERIAEGEPGGFYHQWAQLADGSLVHVITNDGHDTLRIYSTSHFQESKEEPQEEQPSDSIYMWVGVRIKWEGSEVYTGGSGSGVPPWALMCSLAEPWVDGQPQGMLWLTSNAGWSESSKADLSDPNAQLFHQFGAAIDVPGMVHEFFDTWGGDAFHQEQWPEGWHCLGLFDSSFDSDEMFYTRNGLLGFDWLWCQAGTQFELRPFDPLLPADDQLSERGLSDDKITAIEDETGSPVCAWDTVYVLDSHPDEGEPQEERAAVLNAYSILEGAGMAVAEARALPGEYLLNIGAYGEHVVTSSRNGETVPTLSSTWKRNGRSDFVEYLQGNQLTPMTVEVEVRLGKEPDMSIFNFELVLPTYSETFRNSYPFGAAVFGTPQVCEGDWGPNTMGNWYAQSIGIDVLGRSAYFTDNRPEAVFTPSNHVLESFDYHPYRYPPDIYIHGDFGVSQVSDANYPDFAAQAVARMLDEMTTGFWGFNLDIRERLYGDILGAAGGLVKGYVYHYNVATNTFTQLPIISEVDDYDYVAEPSRRNYEYWYYPYRLQSMYQCHDSFGILLGAAFASTTYWHGQRRYPSDPADAFDIPACCPENYFGV